MKYELFGLLDEHGSEFLEKFFEQLHLGEIENVWEDILEDGKETLLAYYVEIIEGLAEIDAISISIDENINKGETVIDDETRQVFMDACGLVLVNRNLLIDTFVLRVKSWVRGKVKRVRRAIFNSSSAVLGFIRNAISKLAKWLKLQSWAINITGGVTLGLAPSANYSAGLTFTFGP